MHGLIERHHDYVLGPNQDSRLASVAAGKSLSLALELDSDAPFLLRSRALRCRYDANNLDMPGLTSVLMKFTGPNRDYRSQNFIRQSLLSPYFGLIGNPMPESPEIFYPRQSTIFVDITNDGATAITNLYLYFRGVKLFAPGVVKSYGYPAKFSGLPFVYPQTQITSVPVATRAPIRYTFRCKTDADFVLRGGQANSSAENFALEVFITMRDEDEKPYSNDGIHLDVLFGNSRLDATFDYDGGTAFAPVGGGPNSMGLFYPEIYVPRNHLLYYDISRNDTFAAGAGAEAVDIPISFIGQKVFSK